MPFTAVAAMVVAAGLGLRHALDPDHLVAVMGLAAEREGQSPARTARIGFCWGAGHATSLMLAGLFLISLGWNSTLLRGGALEHVVGVAIVAIGVRLFVRQRHRAHIAARADHAPDSGYWLAVATGMLHGLAGSGGVTLALLPLVPNHYEIVALLIFATMTCISMTLCSLAFGSALSRPMLHEPVRRRARQAVAVGSIIFGLGYAAFA